MSDIVWFPYAVGMGLVLFVLWLTWDYHDPDRDGYFDYALHENVSETAGQESNNQKSERAGIDGVHIK
jgi:hypothetical protein